MEKMADKDSLERETVIGVVIPNGWDADFRCTSFFLACDEEREIGIANPMDWPQLADLSRKLVQAEGVVAEGELHEMMEIDSLQQIIKTA